MRICNVEDCGQRATSRGLCNPHYQMWYHGYNMPVSPLLKHGNKQEDIEILQPSIQDLYWLVGLLEGEGHFSYSRTQQLVLGMTDEDVIIKAKRIIEKITRTEKPIHLIITNWRREELPMFTIRLYGAKARAMLKLIVPYMGERRRGQIWRTLNGYTGRRTDMSEIVKLITNNG